MSWHREAPTPQHLLHHSSHNIAARLPTTTPTMLTRTLRPFSRASALPRILRASYADSSASAGQVPANDPNPRTPKPNVSATNALPTSSQGNFDKVLQESPVKGEELRTLQAPNRQSIWSRSQQPREVAMSGPRFEQTNFEDQVRRYGVNWTY
jgi:NADH dehydrogenase (ubiquinone) Fe-S protein 6